MSTSTFHHHFRAMTALSPLQYQKKLRLQEARRLMLVEQRDAASAAFEVGYESPSQFSREYKRHFGRVRGRATRSARVAYREPCLIVVLSVGSFSVPREFWSASGSWLLPGWGWPT